jgi:hypothetical protein
MKRDCSLCSLCSELLLVEVEEQDEGGVEAAPPILDASLRRNGIFFCSDFMIVKAKLKKKTFIESQLLLTIVTLNCRTQSAD